MSLAAFKDRVLLTLIEDRNKADMTETIWVALIGLVAALGAPWMNALAKRWLESRKGKKAPARPNVHQAVSNPFERLISKLIAGPFYAIAIWMFLIAPGEFSDGRPFKGVAFLIISAIFVVVAHYTSEWLTGPPQSK